FINTLFRIIQFINSMNFYYINMFSLIFNNNLVNLETCPNLQSLKPVSHMFVFCVVLHNTRYNAQFFTHVVYMIFYGTKYKFRVNEICKILHLRRFNKEFISAVSRIKNLSKLPLLGFIKVANLRIVILNYVKIICKFITLLCNLCQMFFMKFIISRNFSIAIETGVWIEHPQLFQ
ncbi:hypothetical protein L9F63_003339, partial [Diploptera punctata]